MPPPPRPPRPGTRDGDSDYKNWSVEQVSEWVSRQGAGQEWHEIAQRFQDERICGESLHFLKPSHLVEPPLSLCLGDALRICVRLDAMNAASFLTASGSHVSQDTIQEIGDELRAYADDGNCEDLALAFSSLEQKCRAAMRRFLDLSALLTDAVVTLQEHLPTGEFDLDHEMMSLREQLFYDTFSRGEGTTKTTANVSFGGVDSEDDDTVDDSACTDDDDTPTESSSPSALRPHPQVVPLSLSTIRRPLPAPPSPASPSISTSTFTPASAPPSANGGVHPSESPKFQVGQSPISPRAASSERLSSSSHRLMQGSSLLNRGRQGASNKSAPVRGSRGMTVVKRNNHDSMPADYARWQRMTVTDRRRTELQRASVLSEILESEREYVADLNIIVSVFILPLRQYYQQIDVSLLSSNIEEIVVVNERLLADLEVKCAKLSSVTAELAEHAEEEEEEEEEGKEVSECPGIGEVFQKHAAALLKTYVVYISAQEKVFAALAKLKSNEDGFRRFLQEAMRNPKCRLLDLNSFLIKPVQRICKYGLLLLRLLDATSPENPDFGPLSKACVTLQDLTNDVNEMKRFSENLSNLKSVEARLSNCDFNLYTPNRQYIREDTFTKISKKKAQKRRVFVFNDVLVYARIHVGKDDGVESYEYRGRVFFHQALIRDHTAHENAFEIVRVDKKLRPYIMCASSQAKKMLYFEELFELIAQAVASGQNQKAGNRLSQRLFMK